MGPEAWSTQRTDPQHNMYPNKRIESGPTSLTPPCPCLICVFLVLDHVFQEFVAFFKNSLSRKVCWADRMEFINGWYILLIISDFLTIIGSFIKIGIESKVSLGVCGRRVPIVGNL